MTSLPYILLNSTKSTTDARLLPQSTYPNGLVPNASRPMVWYGLFSLRLQLLHRIIQEKIDQNGIDLRIRMLAFDLAPDEFHHPNATGCIILVFENEREKLILTPKLYLVVAPTFYNLLPHHQ